LHPGVPNNPGTPGYKCGSLGFYYPVIVFTPGNERIGAAIQCMDVEFSNEVYSQCMRLAGGLCFTGGVWHANKKATPKCLWKKAMTI
jgi:hypothetical protein